MLLQYGPHFFSTLSEKFGQLARFFWANGLPPPLAKSFPYAYATEDTKWSLPVKPESNLCLSIHIIAITNMTIVI